jgi:hypothetical protein
MNMKDRIRSTVEQMRREDREFITAETVAMFAHCSQTRAAAELRELGFTDAQVGPVAVEGVPAMVVRGRYECSNGGISSQCERVVIVATIDKTLGADAVVEAVPEECRREAPSKGWPAVAIKFRSGGSLGALPPCAVPVEVAEDGTITETRRDDSVGPMMGGARIVAELNHEQAFTLVSRQETLSVDLHDRFETTAQYATHD